jgi:hypothetical protein
MDDGWGVLAEHMPAAGKLLHEWGGVFGDAPERVRGNMDDGGDMFAESMSAARVVLHQRWRV